MAFRFRLQRIRDWQADECAKEKEALRSILTAVSAAREAIASERVRFAAQEEEMSSRRELAVAELQAWAESRASSGVRTRSLEATLASHEAAAEQQTRRYTTARARLKLIDRIRDREAAEHAAAEDRELDEVSQTIFNSHLTKRC